MAGMRATGDVAVERVTKRHSATKKSTTNDLASDSFVKIGGLKKEIELPYGKQ